MVQLKISITGRVQGVGFRQYTAHHARRLKLRGFVRNLPDGSVECLAGGEGETMKSFLALLQKGPPFSRVDQVQTNSVNSELPDHFQITN